MFFAALDRLRAGSLVCVFDATDRIQHMFWRDIDPGASRRARARERRRTATPSASSTATTTRWSAACGRSSDDGDVLMVISDHGFNSFRRGRQPESVAAARGLSGAQAGHRRAAPSGCATWTGRATRAYALGLTGLFLNLKGREAQGIVKPGAEAAALKSGDRRQAARPARRRARRPSASTKRSTPRRSTPARTSRTRPISSSATTPAIAPRGTARRASCRVRCSRTTSSRGAATTASTRGWCPACSSAIARSTRQEPALIDIAPTALRLFGIEPPAHMDGRAAGGSHDDAPRRDRSLCGTVVVLALASSRARVAMRARARRARRRSQSDRARLRRPRLRR